MDIISTKALRLLQNLCSLKEINKKLLPLNDEFKPSKEYEYFSIKDYFPYIYEESINLLIELSILMRREAEKEIKYGCSINSKVKYSSMASYESGGSISFYDILSKIIHAEEIEYEMKIGDKICGYGYSSDRNSHFSGNAIITGLDKSSKKYTAKIDVIKFCINIFSYTADQYDLM